MKSLFVKPALVRAVFTVALCCFLFGGNQSLFGQQCISFPRLATYNGTTYVPIPPACPPPGYYVVQTLTGMNFIVESVTPYFSYKLVPVYSASTVYIGATPNGLTKSNGTGAAQAQPTKKFSDDEITSNPEFIAGNAYPGTAGCTVSSGKKPLVLNTAKPAAKNAKAPSPLSLCKEGCDKAVEWAVTPVNKDNLYEGVNISTTGKGAKYLAWDEKTGLSVIAKPTRPTEAEKTAMTWHVGIGEINKGEVTGYQILTKASPEHGLVINKKTGAVAVERIYTKSGEEKLGDGTFPVYKRSAESDAVWKLGDCKPLPTAPNRKETGAAVVQSLIVELKPGIDPAKWVMQYQDLQLRVGQRLAPDRNLWLVHFNQKEISLEKLLPLVKQSADVVEAQGNQEVKDRD